MRKAMSLLLLFGLLAVLVTPTRAEGPVVHEVKAGENLFRIGLRYGVTVDALAAANGLRNPSHVYVGQRLTIPTGRDGTGSSNVSAGTHVVQRGENLYRIALRYGTTYQTLARANGIVNPNQVYVGQRLRIPGHDSAQPATDDGASAGNAGRWIDVDLSAQRLTAYEGDTPVRSTLVSTGRAHTPTPPGRYRIYVKYRSTDMGGPGYFQADVPHAMFFYKGYSIHGTYWHSNFGHPMSHGCVNLPQSEAAWLYAWASVGTLVNVHR
jgi:lipoprotein-anchoring transpeptidase ErfK/SrfK